MRRVRGPGSVPNTWWDRLCPTFCDRSWDPRSTAPTRVWSSYCPTPLLAPAPVWGSPRGPQGPKPTSSHGQQRWARKATPGPPPEGLVWVGGVDSLGHGGRGAHGRTQTSQGSKGAGRQTGRGCSPAYLQGHGVGHTQTYDMQEKNTVP